MRVSLVASDSTIMSMRFTAPHSWEGGPKSMTSFSFLSRVR